MHRRLSYNRLKQIQNVMRHFPKLFEIIYTVNKYIGLSAEAWSLQLNCISGLSLHLNKANNSHISVFYSSGSRPRRASPRGLMRRHRYLSCIALPAGGADAWTVTRHVSAWSLVTKILD